MTLRCGGVERGQQAVTSSAHDIPRSLQPPIYLLPAAPEAATIQNIALVPSFYCTSRTATLKKIYLSLYIKPSVSQSTHHDWCGMLRKRIHVLL